MSAAVDAGEQPGKFNMPNRRDFLAGSAILGVAAASVAFTPKRVFKKLTAEELGAAIPEKIGEYTSSATSGLIAPATDELSEKLYDETLMRIYVAPNKVPVLALFAYGSVQNLSLELHRPEECYPQQGFTLSNIEPLPLTLEGHNIPATALTASRLDGYVEQLLYWSRIGTQFPATKNGQSIIVTKENLAGRMPDGILVRLSMPVRDRQAGIDAGVAFMRKMADVLNPQGQRIVFGQTV